MRKFKKYVYLAIPLLTLIYLFVETPNINPLYPEGAFFWAVLVTVIIGVWAIMKFGQITFESFKTLREEGVRPGVSPFKGMIKGRFPKSVKFLLALPWIFMALMILVSSPIISWKAYKDQLGEPEIKKFTSEVQAIDVSQVPIVDQRLAYTLASKKLGERPSLGSQTTPGEPTIQMVDGKLVWIVPLHHSGVFKWLSNMDGTPGYVVVSATNINDVDYVEGFKIKYHPRSYLLQDLIRHIRLKGYWFDGITDYSFEVSDEGQPYWVVTTYKMRRGFALPEATGAIIVNATNGEINKYTIDELPEWVDRIQPEDFVRQQINNRGKYVHGIFNFSNKDKYEASDGQNIVYNNGNNYLFTGITSVGADESAMGFMMVDMVTKEAIQYQMSGATEFAARRSAEGQVQDQGYKATMPIILNLVDTPTYFMTLKDNEGLIKRYAFVSVQNYNTVGVGGTMREAVNNYERALKDSGQSSGIGNASGEIKEITSEVLRISSEYQEGVTVYKLIVEGESSVIYVAESELSQQLAVTREGDTVNLQFVDTQGSVKMATGFENISITDGTIIPPKNEIPAKPDTAKKVEDNSESAVDILEENAPDSQDN